MWPTLTESIFLKNWKGGVFTLKFEYFKGLDPKLAIVFNINSRKFTILAQVGATPPHSSAAGLGSTGLRATQNGEVPSSPQASRLLPLETPSLPHILLRPLSLCPSTRLLPSTQTPALARRSGLGRRQRGHLFSQTVPTSAKHLPPDPSPPPTVST